MKKNQAPKLKKIKLRMNQNIFLQSAGSLQQKLPLHSRIVVTFLS